MNTTNAESASSTESTAGTKNTRRIIRAADRHHWDNEWLDSWQSFPATGNFDLEANAHGVLLVHNDDVVLAGEGLDAHQHRNAEILTWVVEGVVRHRDSSGNEGTITPGTIQRMTAGRGISHSEGNGSPRSSRQRARVIQLWLAPDTDDLEPGYAERDVSADLASGELTVVASGMTHDADTPAISFANRYAALHVARLHAGHPVTIPAAGFGHLYVVSGTVRLDTGEIVDAGDAVRTTSAPAFEIIADAPAEVLFVEMHAGFDL